MSIERLHRAALAAGYAMAAADDDVAPRDDASERRSETATSAQLPAVVSRRSRFEASAIHALAPVAAMGVRFWQRLPNLTGRAAA